MSKPTLKVVTDNTKSVQKIISSFAGDAVLVGIPESESPREEGDPIGNAQIMAINEYGSPQNNIPPRPVMSIGLRNAKDEIADQLGKAAALVFTDPKSTFYLERAGIIATNSIKRAITTQDSIKPPSDDTLAARRSKGFAGTKALIVTGQLRNSITHVLTGLWDNVAALKKKGR